MQSSDMSIVEESSAAAQALQRIPNRYKNYIILLVMFSVYMTVCTVFYTYYENWEPSVALFFIVETMTTVGFGYRTPSDDRSRLFTIFAMIVGIFVVFGGISTALTHRLAYFKSKRKYNDLDRVEEIHKDLRHRLVVNLVAIVVALFTAALLFYTIEDWSFIRSLYFAVQTATSVGYGDIPLHQSGTHIVAGIYTFLSVILLAFAIGNITDIYQERKALGKMLLIAQRKQTLNRIIELDTGSGVSRDTFVLAVLEQLGVLDRETDIEPWIKKFEQFDVEQTGLLRRTEIELFSASESRLGAAQAERIRTLEDRHRSSIDFSNRVADALSGLLPKRGGAARTASTASASASASAVFSAGLSNGGTYAAGRERTTSTNSVNSVSVSIGGRRTADLLRAGAAGASGPAAVMSLLRGSGVSAAGGLDVDDNL